MSESITRLHITPLTADLLPSVLPASLRAAATDISFHTIPTFPENNYGYITLPNMEAEKIKKKLNGSILKGKKFKIESARPSKRQRNEEAESEPAPAEKKKSKKRKSDDQVLEGYELPSDRKVKRGWTEPSGSKKEKGRSEKKNKKEKKEKPQPKSKYTEKPECLFRTTVPPNRSSESADDKNAKKKKKKSSESVVHEFGKTMSHPSFLRSTGDGSAPTATFDEEKGWVDATGAVKEPPSQKARKHDYRPGQVAGTKLKGSGKSSNRKAKTPTPASSSESEDWTSSSGSSDESSDSESEASSSDDSSDSSSDERPKSPVEKKATVAPASSTEDSASAPNAATDDAESEAAQDAEGKEVHPLEALFKRSAPAESQDQPAPNADTGFSFFENGDIESENEAPPAEPQTPFTPFTKRDLQVRGLRSAAPTPDTGLPSRQRQWAEEDMEDDDVSIESPVSKSRGLDLGLGKEETEFAKWFWENRGENNRAWKKRRRDVAKEQRQRENRKKGMKGKS